MSEPLEMLYTNWRGETRVRRVVPLSVRYGTAPPWHPEPCWLLRALDVELGEEREFAFDGFLADVPGPWRPQP